MAKNSENSNIKIKLPFLLANISDRPRNQLLVHEFNSERLELISNLPMQCYGDADVLDMMGFGEVFGPNDINDNLGPEFNDLPEKFSEV